MRALLAAVAVLLFSTAPSAQSRTGDVSGLDLGTSRIVPIANGDLGSGRIVDRFLVTPEQRDLLISHPQAAGAVNRSGANHVVAATGFALVGTPVRDGVADCTQQRTACYVIPDDPDAMILIVNSGAEER